MRTATALAPAEPTIHALDRCVACERDEVRLEQRPGVDGPLCIDPVDCRRRWPGYGRGGYQPGHTPVVIP